MEVVLKKAVVVMPSYGLCSPSAARSLCMASQKMDCTTLNYESSLLAQSFNVLWAGALNTVVQGKQVDYFAMLHSDVEPQGYWLDELVDELEAHRLDVVSAIVPIKNAKGLTSAGYEQDPPADWKIGGRLTMQEVYRLPTTFTREHVGRELVMNTGCWVCKFNPEWAEKVCFNIRDRISKQEDGQYIAEVVPEDWDVSRQFRRLGLKIGLTRRVKLGHRGISIFGNDRVWGSYEFDQDYVTSSIIK